MIALAKQFSTASANASPLAFAEESSPKRSLLLASDRHDKSSELADILQAVGEVNTVATCDIPELPSHDLSGIVVDINLRSPEVVQRVRNRLRHEAYSAMPRLFVLADSLHHGTMQAWALGATDTISRPLDRDAILRRIRAAFPDTSALDASERGQTLNRGVEAAHRLLVKMLEKFPAGAPLSFDEVVAVESRIMKAIKHGSLRQWLTTVACHHVGTYRHCLFATGFAVAFGQHLGMREDDQRRLTRAALLHDVGKAFIPMEILDKPGTLTDAEMDQIRQHPRRGFEALADQGGFPAEMLDVVLHHHEMLDGSGYPNNLKTNQISDIVRLTTIVDIYTALIEERSYRDRFTHLTAFTLMEGMGDKLDQPLLQAFRPVAMGAF